MNDAPHHPHPLIGRGKSLLDQLLRMAQTRLELLSAEIQQEKLALGKQVQLVAIMAVCALLAGITLIVAVALAFPPDTRLIALGVIFLVLVLAIVVCWLILKRQVRRGPLFSRVINQLRLDRASLREEP